MARDRDADALIGGKIAAMPADTIGVVLRARMNALIDHAREASSDLRRPEAIHDFRKAIKRLRPLLRLLEPIAGTPARALRRETGALSDLLDAARDLQGARDALHELGGPGLLRKTVLQAARARLDEACSAAEAEALAADPTAQLHAGLDHAAATIEGWRLERVGFDAFAGSLTRTYRAARRAVPDDWTATSSEALHRLRRRVIEHRYQMVLIKPLWPKLGKAWIAEAENLRNALGAHHDLAGLAALTRGDGPLAFWKAELGPAITVRQAEHLSEAQRHTRLLAERPRAFRHRIEALWRTTHGTA
jgi:CHAD domain-containing protein